MCKSPYARVGCLLISLLLLLCALPSSALADENNLPSMDEASSVYLKHLQSDRVVCSKEENYLVGAGSTVKIMAGLLFCEKLEAYSQQSISITQELYDAIPRSHGRSLKLTIGEDTTIDHLLYAAICGSYNDAFYVLAALASGSVDAFVDEMQARATSMGLKNTVFEDVTGIVVPSRMTFAVGREYSVMPQSTFCAFKKVNTAAA
ncbi:MAG: hypothetical protein IJB94_06445 [Clostridia bacterium]|nr:hypothetical protein [Clostridia bacterium]